MKKKRVGCEIIKGYNNFPQSKILKDLKKENKKLFGIFTQIINDLRYKQLYTNGEFEIGIKSLKKPRHRIAIMEIKYYSLSDMDLSEDVQKELFNWCNKQMEHGEEYIEIY